MHIPWLATVALSLVSVAATAQSPQIVSGRVLADSAHPLAGAIVSVTMAPDRTLKQDTTNADGRWRVRFERASGDYLVHIAAIGRQSFRKRVTAALMDSILTVDATLASSVQQLAAVTVRASRPKPSREGDVFMPDGVSAEHVPMGVAGAVAADRQGDLAALAATIPGLALTPGGVSAFGLDPSQNGVTLNGLSFPGASLPRNANTSTRFSTSTYDPSRGGFAGVETAVTLSPGNVNTHRRANVTLDAPFLQTTDRVSRQLGQRVTGGQGSIGASGVIVEDVWYYNVAADVSRKAADAPSLLDADASLFPLAGVAPDSVSRLLRTLATLGIPASVPGVATQRVNDDASFAVRLDHAPYKPQSFTPNSSTWAVVGLGRVQRSDAQGVGLTFGGTSPAQTTMRLPFCATLDVSIDLGPSTARQQLERALNRGRAGRAGERLSADSIRSRFSRNVRSPYLAIVQEADSLLLSREQVERLREADAKLKVKMDSLWLALGRELSALGDRYDVVAATQRTEDVTDAAWEFARQEVSTIREILSPLQFSLAPGIVQYLASVKGKVMIRMYSY